MKKILEKILTEKETIKKINLSEQYSLKEVPEIIKECTELEKLDISFTGITEIPDFVFQLPKLKELNYLGCTELRSQPKSFSSKQPLEKLSIYIGKNHKFIANIENLTTLKSLVINGSLKEIPDAVYDIPNLQELELFDTKIATVSEKIQQFKKLKKLSFWQPSFSDNDKLIALKLDEIFQNLSKCISLKELLLNNNGIKEIPENILLLNQLQKISVNHNKLESYPNAIYKLTKLIEIDFGINRIKEIPKGIGNLSQLKTLKFNSNWINKLDTKNLFDEISQLKNLENLELWSCQSIKEIPESISHLKKLKKIDLDNNLLEKLPESISTMQHLKTLRISTNKISSEDVSELKKHLTGTNIIA